MAKRYHESPPSPSWSAEIASVGVRFGAGRLAEVGELAGELGAGRAFLVSDPGVRRAGYVDEAVAALEAAGVETAVWDGVEENPTSSLAGRAAEAARELRPEVLVGLGGGSAMDVAKAVAILLAAGGRMEDHVGLQRLDAPLVPGIGVPTTAGTGSEAQSFALISADDDHRKMACGARGARFRSVILDPDLVATAPPRVAATAGLDAVSHAVESYVSRAANPVSRMLAREAWWRLEGALEGLLASGGADSAARARVLLGAHLAGAAIEQSMLGAAHAAANPLTARHGLAHGAAVALILPAVVRFNGAAAEPRYAELAAAAGRPAGPGGGAESVARRIEALRSAAALPASLAEAGAAAPELDRLAAAAAEQWTGRFNPVPLDAAGFRTLYAAVEGRRGEEGG